MNMNLFKMCINNMKYTCKHHRKNLFINIKFDKQLINFSFIKFARNFICTVSYKFYINGG